MKLFNAKRYNQIIKVLGKHGLGFIFEEIGIKKNLSITKAQGDIPALEIIGEKLRLACEELGTTFIKIAQFASTRADVVPHEVITELSKLQDKVKPFEFEKAKKMIEEDFSDELHDIFDDFVEQPIAAASIAQVYKAKLKSGERVAIKVKRPDIRPGIEIDLAILKNITSLISKHTKFGGTYDLMGMVDDFEIAILLELDFINEADNMDRFRENMRDGSNIFVPEVKWIYTNKRILTMEYIDGTKISKLDQFSAADKKKIAKLISTSILNQIIRDGFFHADPHPGNILVKDKSEVYFIDFGLVGILNERIKEDIRKLFIGIGTNNSRLIVESLTTMNKSTYQKKIIKFEKDIDELLDKYLKTNIGNIKIDEFFGAVTKVASKYRITIISEFFLISKCLTTLQQIVESLDPGLNIYEIAKPIVKNIHVKKVDLDEFKSEIMQFAKDYKDLFTTIPYALINFIKKMQDDDYSVGVKITNTKRILRIVNSATNRISFSIVLLAVSIIIAGVIIGNSFSTGSTMDPFNRIVQTVGLILAVIIVVGLAISIFRSFKNK